MRKDGRFAEEKLGNEHFFDPREASRTGCLKNSRNFTNIFYCPFFIGHTTIFRILNRKMKKLGAKIGI